MTRILWDINSDKVLAEMKKGIRLDGRKVDEYRKVSIQNHISENADGSARVRIGETDVMAGVKMLPGEPYPDMPDQGSISVGMELLPLASPSFESGPPREESIELSRVVDRGIRESKAIDFKDLCIKEGEKVWIVFIDMYALNFDGNLFDAASLAALSSLLEAKVPKLDDENKIVKGEFSGKLKLSRKPLLSTFAKVGGTVVLDPMLAEEIAMSARFSVATTDDGQITAFQKGGGGSFTSAEIDSSIDHAFEKAKQLRKLL
ncbi:MAG: exosome complex protein Rrp42 [Candidatus Diapherotrites archaeon]